MKNLNDGLRVEYVAACLAPSDIAPHPNFRTDQIGGAELLALLLQFQWKEYEAYLDAEASGSESEFDPGDTRLLRAARGSLESISIDDGRRELVDYIGDKTYSFGQRAAAALLVAVADSDQDKPANHVGLLDDLAAEIESSNVGPLSSKNLLVAALLQQCAFRSFEAGQLTGSRAFATRVLSTLETSSANDWQEFPVSRGISWSSSETQRRVTTLLEGNAKSLIFSTGDPLDSAWSELVRSPFPTASTRPTRDSLAAMEDVVDRAFNQAYPPMRRSQILLGKEKSLRLLYSSLLHAELAGSAGEIARARRLVGDDYALRAVEKAGKFSEHGEAIRLFRQSDAKKQLEQFLQALRVQGPLDPLRESAEKIIKTRRDQSYITSSDLVLIQRAADLIDISLVGDAINLVLSYMSQELDGRVKKSHVADWKRIETSLRLIASLISVNRDANISNIVPSILQAVQVDQENGNNIAFSSLSSLTAVIDWSLATEGEKQDWLQLARLMQRSREISPIDWLEIYTCMDLPVPEDVFQNLKGHEFVVALLEGFINPNPAEVDRAASVVIDDLRGGKEDAVRGIYVRYTWSPFVLAANMCRKFSRIDVWQALGLVLADPVVSAIDKYDAMKSLVSELVVEPMDSEVRELLKRSPIEGEFNDRDRFSALPSDHFNALRRSFYLAYGLQSPEDAQEEVLRDMGSGSAIVRSETANGCFWAAINDPAIEWPVILLLQLSYDADGNVRHNAARALAYLSVFSDTVLVRSVIRRIEEIIPAPGISTVMGVLRGFIAAAENKRKPGPLWFIDSVISLSSNHGSRNVREAASSVLSLYSMQPNK